MKPTTPFSLLTVTHAARAALQWRMLLVWVLLMLIPTLILSAPLWQMLGEQLDYSVHAAQIARSIDATVFADLMAAHGKSSAAFTQAGVGALIVTLLISPFLSAMVASAARAAATPGFRELVAGGMSQYARMFRMQLFSLLPLGLAIALGGAAMDLASEQASDAVAASDADVASALAWIAAALVFAVAHATLDAGRAALAIERRRTSVIKAWWSGCKLLLRRPVATLGAYLAISCTGLALAAALAVGRINVAGVNLAGLIAAVLLVQVTVAVLGWMRSARLFALIEVARSEPSAG